MRFDMILAVIGTYLLGFALLGLGAFLGAIFFQPCWNYAMQPLFGLPEIGFWQSFCLLYLSALILPSETEGRRKKDGKK